LAPPFSKVEKNKIEILFSLFLYGIQIKVEVEVEFEVKVEYPE
jgi:hypothetical protein